MAKSRGTGYIPTILDRLVDPDAAGNLDRPGYSTKQVIASIESDLLYLFNTRRTVSEVARSYKRLGKVLGYGMPDFQSLNEVGDVQRKQIARDLEAAIQCYEPRLRNVRVELVKDVGNDPLKVRFRMSAQLAIEPCPEVAFDTMMQLSTGRFLAEGES